jgi:hypothetical protein
VATRDDLLATIAREQALIARLEREREEVSPDSQKRGNLRCRAFYPRHGSGLKGKLAALAACGGP